ncbi:MAG TPA: LLM class flavin-dependent oxidoreductase [Mycobacteriales bacterium]|nr:LLM class flavin-dependent oxidoreductase [Mycobacteriales bacterium]
MNELVDSIAFGVVLPTLDPFRRGTVPLLPAARLAEGLGFDSAWVGDHLTFHAPILESMCALAAAAAVTDRIRLGFGVMLLGLRNPVWAAKQVGTLAALAPGRVLLGVGVGGEHAPEFEAAGVALNERGKRVDESLEIVTTLLRGRPVDHAGPLLPTRAPVLEPVPTAAVPLVVGGRSEAALARAGRWADAWLAIWVDGPRLTRACGELADRAAAHGRPTPKTLVMVFIHVCSDAAAGREEAAAFVEGQYGVPFAQIERWCMIGDEDDVVGCLVEIHDAGAAGFICLPAARDPLGQYERLALVRDRVPR